MSTTKLQIYDVFTRDVFGGNIAGVICEGQDLSEAAMQTVAREIGVPATGFVSNDESADFAIRFFTPGQEIAMCGHGLIAACTQLVAQGTVKAGAASSAALTVQTSFGPVHVRVDPGEVTPVIMLGQKVPEYRPYDADPSDLYRALGLPSGQAVPDLPIEIAAGALNHLIVPAKSLGALEGLQPDLAALAKLSQEIGVISIDLFTMETVHAGSTVHSRDFCPAVGIPEAAGSGTTNSALFCYLIRNGVLSASDGDAINIRAEQGYEMGRPAGIRCEAMVRGGEIHDLMVGGAAVKSIEGTIKLPDAGLAS